MQGNAPVLTAEERQQVVDDLATVTNLERAEDVLEEIRFAAGRLNEYDGSGALAAFKAEHDRTGKERQ